MEQSTNAGVPRGTLAALNHLGGVVILMLSSLLEFVCVLMLRLNDGVIGARRGARGDTSDVTSRRDPTGTPHDHSVNAQARPVSIAEIQAIEPAKVKAVQAAPAKPNATQPLDRTARAIEQKTVPATAKRIATREPQQAEAPEEMIQDNAKPIASYAGSLTMAMVMKHTDAKGVPYQCFTVKLSFSLGKFKLLQGKELATAIKSAGVKEGDRIRIDHHGKQWFSLNGEQIYRNSWTVTKI